MAERWWSSSLRLVNVWHVVTPLGTDPQHLACAGGSLPVAEVNSHLTETPAFLNCSHFVYLFGPSELQRVPRLAHNLLSGLLSSSLWNCRVLNFAVGLFILAECLLTHLKHSFSISFFPPSPVHSPKLTFCEPKKEEACCCWQIHVCIDFFSSKPLNEKWY